GTLHRRHPVAAYRRLLRGNQAACHRDRPAGGHQGHGRVPASARPRAEHRRRYRGPRPRAWHFAAAEHRSQLQLGAAGPEDSGTGGAGRGSTDRYPPGHRSHRDAVRPALASGRRGVGGAMRSICRATLFALAGMLGACTMVGPDYQVPSDAVIQRTDASALFDLLDNAHVDQAPLPADWWKLYDDALLDRLVHEALANNTDVRLAYHNLRRAYEGFQMAHHAQEVEFGAAGSLARGQLSSESLALAEKIPVMNLADAGLSVGYQLDLFGKLKRAAESAGASADASAVALDAARITVVAQVVRNYLAACHASEELKIAEHSLGIQQQQLDVRSGCWLAVAAMKWTSHGPVRRSRCCAPNSLPSNRRRPLRSTRSPRCSPVRPAICLRRWRPATTRRNWLSRCRWAMAAPCSSAVRTFALPSACWPRRRPTSALPPR